MKLTNNAPTIGQIQCFSYSQSIDLSESSFDDVTFKIKYYIKFLTSISIEVNSTFQYQITVSDSGLKSWNATDKTFVSGNYINEIDETAANQFISYSTTLSEDGLVNPSNSINIRIYNTVCTATQYETTYFDNLEVSVKKVEAQTAEQKFVSKLTNSENNTTIKTRKALPIIYPGYSRTRERFGFFNTTNLYRGITDITNQNIANDFREFLTRYEGTFRNLKVQPLSMHNKVWFYWTDFETDPQTTIIDGLKYDVKNASFKLKSHLPNDDDDVDVDFIVN